MNQEDPPRILKVVVVVFVEEQVVPWSQVDACLARGSLFVPQLAVVRFVSIFHRTTTTTLEVVFTHFETLKGS